MNTSWLTSYSLQYIQQSFFFPLAPCHSLKVPFPLSAKHLNLLNNNLLPMALEYTVTKLTAWQNRWTDNCVCMCNIYHSKKSRMTYSWHRLPSLTAQLSVVRSLPFTPINLTRTLAHPDVNKLTEQLKTSAVLVTSRQPRWPHEPHSSTRLPGPTLHFTHANTSNDASWFTKA